jgi:hypothetical protein
MSTSTYRDGTLSMTPDDKLPKYRIEEVRIVAVKNGWMLYELDPRACYDGVCVKPTHVYNDVDALLLKVRELLVPDAKPVVIMGVVTPNPMAIDGGENS